MLHADNKTIICKSNTVVVQYRKSGGGFSMGVYDVAEIRRRIEPVFQANRVRSAILFGSYAKGVAHENSDIDLLVDSGLRGLDFVELIESTREALDKNIDMLDLRHVAEDSPVMREIHTTGIRIYGQ
jgi:predicted nucleotidyltransferase